MAWFRARRTDAVRFPYLAHLGRHGLDPGKLVELSREANAGQPPANPDIRWMGERTSMIHDLWHVLTGYGADQLGEAALLLFSLAQKPEQLLDGSGSSNRFGPGLLVGAWLIPQISSSD